MSKLRVIYLYDDRRGCILGPTGLTRQEALRLLHWMYQGFSPPESFAIAKEDPFAPCVMVTDAGNRITCERGPYTAEGWESLKASLWPAASAEL